MKCFGVAFALLTALAGCRASAAGFSGCSLSAHRYVMHLLGGKVTLTQHSSEDASFESAGNIVTLDTFLPDCHARHVVIHVREASTIHDPTSSLRIVKILTKGDQKVVAVTDVNGKHVSYRQFGWPVISLYRFDGKYHLAIARNSKDLQPAEVGIAVSATGPFLFSVAWPEPGPAGGWPVWPGRP